MWVTGMDDVVPGALQRLREADIVGLAGLAGASLGQEYCRRGYVSTTKRQGARLSGVVTLPEAPSENESTLALVEQLEGETELSDPTANAVRSFEVAVELLSRDSCQAVCTCGRQATLICTHAAALLYQWITRPHAFVSLLSTGEGSSDPL